MFNYPIKVKKFGKKYKCISPHEISKGRYRHGFILLGKYKVKNGLYYYEIDFNEGFSSTIEQSALWAALEISLEEFEPTLDWIEFPPDCLILPILEKSKSDISPTQMEMVVEYILDRPEERYIDYVESTLVFNGVYGIISSITQLEIMIIDTVRDVNSFTRRYITNREVINQYNLIDIDKYAYSCDSLVDKFLIKTDGFNQCFTYDKENYSSVVIKKEDNKYKVYIYGCDDSSYTKYFNTLEEAIFDCEILTKLSRVINKSHIKALKYEFTN